jgi:hypothetical protein
MTNKIEEIEQRLNVLKNYEKVFLGNVYRQNTPQCCGLRFDLNLLLRSQTRTIELDVEGTPCKMFEVTCPECGKPIPPSWHFQ